MRLGSFGKIIKEAEVAVDAKIEYTDDFEWFGQPIRIRNWFGAYPMYRLATLIEANARLVRTDSLAILNSVLEACIVPEDWPQFQYLALTNDVDSATLQELVENLYLLWCGRPFSRPSDSSDGPPTPETEEESPESSSPQLQDSKPQASSGKPKRARKPVEATSSL